MLKVYVDFKSPGAYLAMQPTLALIRKYDLSVIWCPFKTTQHGVPSQRDDEDRSQTHRRVRAIARQDMHKLYARVQGVEMNFPVTHGATDLALTTLGNLTGTQAEFVQAAFRAYWVDRQDLNDVQVVEALLRSVNATPSDEGNGATDLSRLQEHAEHDGVVDAPAYVIGEQLFIGREHLPWVERLVRDQLGL